MLLNSSVGIWLHVISGLLLIALGAFVASVRPRTRVCLALGAFAAAWGVDVVVDFSLGPFGVVLLDEDHALNQARRVAIVVSSFAAAFFLVLVAWWFPRPLAASERRLAIVPALVVLALGLAGTTIVARDLWGPDLSERLSALTTFGDMWLIVAFVFALAMMVQRARRETSSAEAVHQLALVSGALVLAPGVLVGILPHVVPPSRPFFALMYAALVGIAALWLHLSARPAAPARAASRLALLMLLMPPSGWLLAVLFEDVLEVRGPAGIAGVARILTVALLAYAILRHRLLGIDVKVKWTMKQSTVAATFLAVFFAVSEGAQALFSGRWGTPLGILAAAGLLFAIHPLQHVAQRVADKAMPGVKGVGEMGADERAAAYRELARTAWADGSLSSDERRMLETARERLMLTHDEAHRIESDVAPP